MSLKLPVKTVTSVRESVNSDLDTDGLPEDLHWTIWKPLARSTTSPHSLSKNWGDIRLRRFDPHMIYIVCYDWCMRFCSIYIYNPSMWLKMFRAVFSYILHIRNDHEGIPFLDAEFRPAKPLLITQKHLWSIGVMLGGSVPQSALSDFDDLYL